MIMTKSNFKKSVMASF